MTEIRKSFSDVLDATREFILAQTGRTASWLVPGNVAARLGVGDDYNRPKTRSEHDARQRFEGQVTRALNKLADDAEIRKVGRGQVGPDGSHASNSAHYYSFAAWDAAAKQQAEKQAQAAEAKAAWAAVYDRLEAAGFTPHAVSVQGWRSEARGRAVYLDLEDMQRLLDSHPWLVKAGVE